MPSSGEGPAVAKAFLAPHSLGRRGEAQVPVTMASCGVSSRSSMSAWPSPPPAQGLYDPKREHDACGVGFVADLRARPSHKIIEHGLQILENLTHRGAV